MRLAILTATYNRKQKLKLLVESLNEQKNMDFDWFVIDDGSTDGTEDYIRNIIQKDTLYHIEYRKIPNGGKSRAINVGLDLCHRADFVLIVDDDEFLYSNATSLIYNYINKYINSKCVGMEFLRDDQNGKPISNYKIEDDLVMSVQRRKRLNYEIDGYTGYFLKKLGKKRFPEYPNEKYVGPGVLQMIACENNKYDLVWPAASIGRTEYLENGITHQGRRLRIKNPCGMITYCGLIQSAESGVCVRIKYSIMAYAYGTFICDKTVKDKLLNSYNFKNLFSILGVLLGKYWKYKYHFKKNSNDNI